MPQITAINDDDDLDAALERIGELLRFFEEDTPEAAELDALSKLVREYEAIHYPIGPPTPAGAIHARLEDLALSGEDLIPILGRREVVDEVLAGRCAIPPAAADALQQLLGIDREVLLQRPAAALVANP